MLPTARYCVSRYLAQNHMVNSDMTLASEIAANQKGHHQVAFYRIRKVTGSG